MKVPDELRARVTRDLRPVRPLLRPWQRALLLVPAAALAFAAAPGVFGLRGDLPDMGELLAWGGSLVQLGVSLALMAAALREAVPGDARPASSARLLLAAGAALIVVLAAATSVVSPEPRPRSETFADWFFCWRGVVLAGVPLLLALLVLVFRGLSMRPALAGALAGMAAGTAVDGGWRLSCNYSHPFHVIVSHGGGVLALTLAGAAIAVTLARLRQRKR
ncbi:MAG: NrsF family protein [Vicinamibacterales bacterium]